MMLIHKKTKNITWAIKAQLLIVFCFYTSLSIATDEKHERCLDGEVKLGRIGTLIQNSKGSFTCDLFNSISITSREW
ncbi:MAG: hypothetical protein HQK49_22520 [Oligoflexia bacterium]|nr:hypothetical protein [Oligoflexia bacterium]